MGDNINCHNQIEVLNIFHIVYHSRCMIAQPLVFIMTHQRLFLLIIEF